MKAAKILVGLPVGAIVSILILSAALGGIESALFIITLSIICTGGIGLVIWIPVWWLVGWLFLSLVIKIAGPGPGSSTSVQPQRTPRDVQALQSYITTARSYGDSEETIRTNLLAAGWPEGLIETAKASLG